METQHASMTASNLALLRVLTKVQMLHYSLSEEKHPMEKLRPVFLNMFLYSPGYTFRAYETAHGTSSPDAVYQ